MSATTQNSGGQDSDAQNIDAQDIAEVLDEDNLDADTTRVRRADEELNFDDMPRVLDATRAVGDEDDDDGLIGEEMTDEDIVRAARDNDDDDEDLEDDELKSRSADQYEPEISLDTVSDVGNEDADDTDDIDRGGKDEVGLRYAGDMTQTLGGHSAAQRYESKRLSDEDLQSLGYAKVAKPDAPHSKDDDAPDALTEDVPEGHPAHPAMEDERLDEGVEETFPASDPVSVKHIT